MDIVIYLSEALAVAQVMFMKKLIFATVIACSMGALCAVHADEPAAEKLDLKNGGTLFLHPDGTSRMVDGHGKKIEMNDGKEMDLKDGHTILMQNKKVWVRYGPPSKQHEHLKND